MEMQNVQSNADTLTNTLTAKTRHLLMIIALTTLCNSQTIAQQDYAIDNSHTSVIFSISHFRIGYLYGRFNRCSGRVALDQFDSSLSEFSFKIESNSIDTNNADRDTALKSVQFLDAASYPSIQFESTSVREKDETYFADGTLRIKGVAKKVTLPFRLLGTGEGPMGKTRIGMLCKFKVKRSEYGITEMEKNIGDDVAITFSFQAVRK